MTEDGGAPAPEFKPIASQEDLDRIIGDRLARERGKFADYDDLKAKAAKFDEVDAASKSELQKLQDAVAERDAKLASLPADVRRQAIKFASIATSKGFIDPEDALMGIDADLADDAAVTAALDALAERKPHLVREVPKKPAARPKPKADKDGEDGPDPGLEGKERAAAALRQFSSTR